MIPVKYVGLKEDGFVDHLYGSGVRWAKPGEVQDVEPYAASRLLSHPEFEDARKGKSYGTPIKAEAPEKDIEDDQRPAPVQLDAMTKAEITQYAKRSFGVDLDAKETKAELVSKVSRMVGMARI